MGAGHRMRHKAFGHSDQVKNAIEWVSLRSEQSESLSVWACWRGDRCADLRWPLPLLDHCSTSSCSAVQTWWLPYHQSLVGLMLRGGTIHLRYVLRYNKGHDMILLREVRKSYLSIFCLLKYVVKLMNSDCTDIVLLSCLYQQEHRPVMWCRTQLSYIAGSTRITIISGFPKMSEFVADL